MVPRHLGELTAEASRKSPERKPEPLSGCLARRFRTRSSASSRSCNPCDSSTRPRYAARWSPDTTAKTSIPLEMPLEHLHLQTDNRNPEPQRHRATLAHRAIKLTRATRENEMNPPDWKHSMNPKPKPNLYHGERGFMAGTGEPGNWKPLVLSIPPCLPSSAFSTRNRKTRALWSSMIPRCGTIRLENPGSGQPAYQVEPDVSSLCPHRRHDSGSGWSSLVSPSNETHRGSGYSHQRGSGCLCIERVPPAARSSVAMLLRRLWRRSASQPPTLEPLALAIS